MVANPFPAAMQLCAASNGSWTICRAIQQEQSRSRPQDIWGKDCFLLGTGRSSSKGKGNWKSEHTVKTISFLQYLVYVCYNLFVWPHTMCRHYMPIHIDTHLTRWPAALSRYSIEHPQICIWGPLSTSPPGQLGQMQHHPSASPFPLSYQAVLWTCRPQKAEAQTAALGLESASKKWWRTPYFSALKSQGSKQEKKKWQRPCTICHMPLYQSHTSYPHKLEK